MRPILQIVARPRDAVQWTLFYPSVVSARPGAPPDWDAVERCVREWSPARLLVGVPYNMDGTETVLTATCRAFARQLARRFGLPVDCVDERLTSAAASADLREARRSGARSRRVRREDIDAHAARLILETWLRGPAH